MGGGYKPPPGDSADALVRPIVDLRRQTRDLQRPGGTRLGSLYDQVQQALANIATTVTDAINSLSYTKSEIDSRISTAVASPGNITPGSVAASGPISGTAVSSSGDVNASGQVVSAGVIVSPGTKANTVTTGYSSLWADASGNFGANTSSRRYKQDITPVLTDLPGFLGLTTYRFRYIAAVEEFGDDAPWELGLIAEDVVEVAPWACFYEEDGVTVKGINYDRLVVALLNVVQDHEQRLTAAGL
jgi:hypothetical protein